MALNQAQIDVMLAAAREAREKANALIDVAIAALEKAGPKSDHSVFKRAADQALEASKNWQQASENLLASIRNNTL